jgi:putative transposase
MTSRRRTRAAILPSKRLERAIHARKREDRIAGRQGEAAADQDARLVKGGLVTTRPLQVVEIDHTLSGLILVDRETGYILGRAWVTAAIDHFTGLILGVVITFHPPSVATMLAVIRQAILWKDELLSAYPEIKCYWPAFGVMETVMIDNASEMHAKLVRDALRFLHVDVTYPPVGKPKFRGTVERFMGRLDADLLRCLPGYTFDIRHAARKQSMKLARIMHDGARPAD